MHKTTKWTTSVCNGSLILSAAALLNGTIATCHWGSFDLLKSLGAIPTDVRVVHQGKIVTAAGVSSGIDMVLHLLAWELGEDIRKSFQLILENDPQPPYDAGSPKKAPSLLVVQIGGMLQELAKPEPNV